MVSCAIEIYARGAWRRAGELVVDDVASGYAGAARFDYDFDYLDAVGDALGTRGALAVSCRFPLGYETFAGPRWPAFVLDVLPSGAARRFWEAELELPNAPRSDWAVLVHGGGYAPGNLRVAEGVRPLPPDHVRAEGFPRAEVLQRGERFLEYVRANGVAISGGSGAGGDSPKYLLREDLDGRLHADGALADARTAQAWLVKFPRSRRALDALVLRAEPGYLEVARELGVRVGAPLHWEDDCLFVPRFDRVVEEREGARRVEPRAVESLYSLAGVTEHGAPTPLDVLVEAAARFATEPTEAVRELVLRDVLSLALGNTDNHGRNTAVTKDEVGGVELSPLYDFAPMLLDTGGVARVCRWRHEQARGGLPDFDVVAEVAAAHARRAARDELRTWLRELSPRIAALPGRLDVHGVPADVTTRVAPRCEAVAAALARRDGVASTEGAP